MHIRSLHSWRLTGRLLSILACAGMTMSLHATTVTVDTLTKQLMVNGQAFTVKGVNYSPTPVGDTAAGPSANCIGPYQWWTDRPTYIADFPQIHRLGANTIRTFDLMNSTLTATQVRQALDSAQANGLYVIMGYYASHFTNPADATFRAQAEADFLAAVNAYKDHPAVLMWAFGNENNLDNANGNAAWYTLVQQVAHQTKLADPLHPIITVEGECLAPDCPANLTFLKNIGSVALNANDGSLGDLDLWGVNIYRGQTFQGVFQALAVSSMTAKPILVTEFGKDAWHDTTSAEDQTSQASYLSAQWQEINTNLSATSLGTSNLVGGIVFEWSDEWWKDSGDDCLTHGAQVLFHRTSDLVDPNYQDEWFGITALDILHSINGTQRIERKSFSALQAFWNPGALSAAAAASQNFFADIVRNYPNPFQAGTSPTRFVALVNEAGTIDLALYDASGRFVTSLPPINATGPGRYEWAWDGKNRQGETVSPGLYYARIEGKGASHQDKQFRRVVAVK